MTHGERHSLLGHSYIWPLDLLLSKLFGIQQQAWLGWWLGIWDYFPSQGYWPREEEVTLTFIGISIWLALVCLHRHFGSKNEWCSIAPKLVNG